jgi:apolipoprotein N-acyltransferase
MTIDAPKRPTEQSLRWRQIGQKLRRSPYFPAVVALLGGLSMALAPAPLNWWGLAWVSLVPLWWAIDQLDLNQVDRQSARQRFVQYQLPPLLWSLAYHGISIGWITGLHPLTWMGLSWVNSVAIVTFAWAAITFWGVASVLVWAWGMRWATRLGLGLGMRILAGTALWCAIEYVRSLSPLDWTALAYTQSPGNLAILHLGQLSGNATISAAIVGVNGFVAAALGCRWGELWRLRRERERHPRYAQRWWLSGLGLLVLSHAIGLMLYLQPLQDSVAEALNVGIVQGNIPTRMKLSGQGIQQAFRDYTQGYRTLAGQGVDVVLTSEGAMPFAWERRVENALDRAIKQTKTPLWLGSFGAVSRGIAGDSQSQSLFALNAEGQPISRYDKVKLVPLGESMPPLLESVIGRLSPLRGYLTPGLPGQRFETGFGLAGVGICYESAFAELFRLQVKQGATFLITASNLDPYSEVLMAQHQAHDVMRSIEADRWMVRATNTGYSGVINPHGQVIWQSPAHQFVTHADRIYRRHTKTPYVLYGNWLTPVLLLLAGAALIGSR